MIGLHNNCTLLAKFKGNLIFIDIFRIFSDDIKIVFDGNNGISSGIELSVTMNQK